MVLIILRRPHQREHNLTMYYTVIHSLTHRTAYSHQVCSQRLEPCSLRDAETVQRQTEQTPLPDLTSRIEKPVLLFQVLGDTSPMSQ
jgi:hypothetical protein